jgi:peptide/nickel transport system ATP-binding protein
MGLVPPPGIIAEGEIWFQGENGAQPVNLLQMSQARLQQYRGSKLAMIFQEPMSSLNPVYTIGFQLTEAIRLHQKFQRYKHGNKRSHFAGSQAFIQ